ncbi:MAG TPA: hypothetical protein VHO46_02940 [Bacteroidales bacterium]|nr:hypothetical protein [Bacteroidales bacterium]
MKEKVQISGTFRIVCIALALTGIVSFIIGLKTNPDLAWGSYLTGIYYFTELSIGAAFYLAIQYISQSGWSSAFKRIPEAMTTWLPFAAIFFFLLYFGMNNIYHWSHEEAVSQDALLTHKSSYLNVTFFFIRMALSFALWIFLTAMMRRLSFRQDTFDPADEAGILALFHKSEMYARILIFVLALTFSLSVFDWIMSLEPHWYSSIFAFKDFIAAFYHGTTIIALIVFILYRSGHFPFLNEYHLHDFARYIFILSIIWGYLWFSQFIIIWYGNIPEETQHFFYRWQGGWKIMFWLQIGLNWGVPFLILLPVQTSRRMDVILSVIIILIIGQYIDIFVEVMPAVTGSLSYSLIEAGIFLGFGGLFALIVSMALASRPLIPRNHPYLIESLEHHFE